MSSDHSAEECFHPGHVDNECANPLPRSDNYADLCEGTAVTVCCGAYATFHDTDLCCKVCWRTVGHTI